MSLSKIKSISSGGKTKYKVIVLSKSGGIDDLIESQAKYNRNISYLSCPRNFFFILMKTFVGNKDFSEKQFFSKNVKKNREAYYNFLIDLLKIVKKKYDFESFIGFNFNYIPEIELHKACESLKISFLLLYKESVGTEIQDKYRTYFLNKIKHNFNGYKIAVYSKLAKNFLVKAGVAKKKQIHIVGCSRLNKSFEYKKIIPENKILYYAIEPQRGIPTYLKTYGKNYFKKFSKFELHNPCNDLKNLHFEIVNLLKNFAKKNPNINIVIKIKIGDTYYKKLYKSLPKNIKLEYGGVGHKLLKKSKIIIGWNSTAILEGIAANRFIIIPDFIKKNINLNRRDELILNLSKNSYVKNKVEFINKLDLLINKKYKPYKNYNNNSSLKYYLGNSDNLAGYRLNKFILKFLIHE